MLGTIPHQTVVMSKSVGSADTAQDRGRAVSALVNANAGPASLAWSGTHRHARQTLNDQRHGHHDEYGTDDVTTVDEDALMGAADQLLSMSSRNERKGELDMCASTWRSVESMARMLAAGQSVASTISKCYSLPELGESGRCQQRQGILASVSRDVYTSLVSKRLAAEALTVFRR